MLTKSASHAGNVHYFGWALPLLLFVATLLAPVPSDAHRGHGVWTDIIWTPQGYEITHRLHAADAIAILDHQGVSGAVDSATALATLALYLEKNFLIKAQGDSPAVTTLGAEFDDDFAYIYQEWPMKQALMPFPAIQNSVLDAIAHGVQRFYRIQHGEQIEERRQP